MENSSEVSECAKSCKKYCVFQVDLDKPWKYQWCFHEKAPPPALAPYERMRSNAPDILFEASIVTETKFNLSTVILGVVQ